MWYDFEKIIIRIENKPLDLTHALMFASGFLWCLILVALFLS